MSDAPRFPSAGRAEESRDSTNRSGAGIVVAMDLLTRIALPAIPLLIAGGLQLSGYTNLPLAVALFAIAAILAVIVAWPYMRVGFHSVLKAIRPPHAPQGGPAQKTEAQQIAKPTAAVPTERHSETTATKYVDIGDWRSLYELGDDGSVRLRFLPDTGLNQQLDTVLLIVLGYRIVNNCDSVPISVVNNETRRAFLDAPNRERVTLFNLGAELSNTLKPPDYGATAVSLKHLERVGLSEGGSYRLTERGRYRAEELAADLIRRA